MSIQIAKKELDSFVPYQRDIHVISDMNEDITSLFFRTFVKSTWFSSVLMKLKSIQDGEDTLYQVNNSFHFLLYSYLRFMLPSIRIKQTYKKRAEVAWCHNVGTNITLKSVFKEDDDCYQTWDNIWADIYFQFYQTSGPGKRDAHNKGIGNVKFLENFAEYLPAYPINVDQPWFYSMDPALAFPIFYKNSLTRAEHRYQFRRKALSLLRVNILGKDNKWKPAKNPHKYLDVDPNLEIKEPELWGRYAYITDNELKWYKCKTSRTFYTRDIEIWDTNNPYKYGSTASLPLHCKNPCLALFWVAENQDAIDSHNYSNYTTNTNNLYEGWDPVKATTLSYGGVGCLENMPSDHFSIATPRKHFPSSPCEQGYHAYSYAWDSTDYNGDIGIVFENLNANLICKIDNNDIFATNTDTELEESDSDEIAEPAPRDYPIPILDSRNFLYSASDSSVSKSTQSPSFILRTRGIVVRKFTIGGENGDYKFTIQ
jgi:hypothetical protein